MARREMKLIYENEKGQSIEFSIWSSFFLEDFNGLDGLKNNIYTTKGMQQDGATYVSSNLDMRNIVIQGRIKDNAQYNKSRMMSILNPKLSGRLIVIQGDSTKYIECKIERAPTINNDKIPKFIMSFICPNPYWNDINKNKVEIALWKGQFHFPLTIPKVKGIIMGLKQPSLIVNIYNKGDVETGMIIEFKARGTLSNPSLFNVNTREYLKINKTMAAGEVIRVNTNYGEKRIENVLNGITTNILNLIDLGGGDTFLQLDVGDNLLRYDADTNPSNLEINIYFSPKYLGV